MILPLFVLLSLVGSTIAHGKIIEEMKKEGSVDNNDAKFLMHPWSHEGWSLDLAGNKLNYIDYDSLYDLIIGEEVRQHWSTRHNIPQEQWDNIYWQDVEKATQSLPRHVSQ